ncbi:hypothetical protein [Candidatus Enterococcus clewellii]|uniref:Uncharacterized protein n=1 Tax=Candidatus Enterococcus clewellii TaxID=1834193 RepID=A0A242K101_9ENTE|nr:hypothetical protein [Enterococcus sp. 9E7_DIV0242]OTP10635.1 hypothetical protein A5888_003933 [Enterococcus sp. 9E7_DIV0242]
MKKVMLIVLLGVGISISNSQVEAAEYKELEAAPKMTAVEAAFAGLEDTDKVVQLPDGTFLYGEATIGEVGIHRNSSVTVNSETAENAVTVEEAKNILEEHKDKVPDKPMLRGVVSSFNYKGLRYGARVSGYFSRNTGWNSLNTVYQSTEGGSFLRYYSGYDSARVGSAQQALQTFSGIISGSIVSAGKYQYFSGINTMYTYYPRDPGQWQSYQIVNID